MAAPRQGVPEGLETAQPPLPHPCRGAALFLWKTGGDTPGYYPAALRAGYLEKISFVCVSVKWLRHRRLVFECSVPDVLVQSVAS